MSILRKIALLVLLPIFALLVLGAVSVYGINKLDGYLQEVNNDSMPRMKNAAETESLFNRVGVLLYRHVITPAELDQDRQDREKRVLAVLDEVMKNVAAYEKNRISSDVERGYLAQLHAALDGYVAWTKRLMELSAKGDKQGALDLLTKEAAKMRTSVTDIMGRIAEFNAKHSGELAIEGGKAHQFALTMVGMTALLMILGGSLTGYLIGRSIVKPVHAMKESMLEVSSTLDFTGRIDAASNDEIGQAGKAYNALLEKLHTSFRQIKDDVGHVSRSAADMTSTSDQIAQGSSVQSEAASSMAASIEQLTVSINHIAGRAKDTRALAGTAGELADDGSRVIVSSIAKINDIAGSARLAADKISDLRKQSESISSVVTVIKEVADQTNLLALNAAIEAARAGEQGRGFAVVADEVRKLAEKTTHSTQAIGELLSGVQASANNAHDSMNAMVALVEEGIEGARTAGTAIERIRAGTQDVAVMVSEISDAVLEQGQASNHIAQQVERIAQMTEENSSSAGHAADSAKELNAMAVSIRDAVAAYRV